jgi:hypothetical protein
VIPRIVKRRRINLAGGHSGRSKVWHLEHSTEEFRSCRNTVAVEVQSDGGSGATIIGAAQREKESNEVGHDGE